MFSAISVLLVDDHALLRKSLHRLIRGEGQVAKASRNRATARAKSPSGPWWHSVNGVVTGWPESEAQRSRSSQLLASRWRSPGTAGVRPAPPEARQARRRRLPSAARRHRRRGLMSED